MTERIKLTEETQIWIEDDFIYTLKLIDSPVLQQILEDHNIVDELIKFYNGCIEWADKLPNSHQPDQLTANSILIQSKSKRIKDATGKAVQEKS